MLSACQVPDCTATARGHGYCGKHYQRWRTHGDPLKVLPRSGGGGRPGPRFDLRKDPVPCSVAKCERKARTRGLCSLHYKRWLRYGDPSVVRSQPKRRNRRRCVTYTAAHWRVRRDFGDASTHLCVRCTSVAAADWAYDYCDPMEAMDAKGRLFGPNSAFYVPLCRPCHRLFDAEMRCRRAAEAVVHVLLREGRLSDIASPAEYVFSLLERGSLLLTPSGLFPEGWFLPAEPSGLRQRDIGVVP